nr:MFS transporter [Sulfobacillus harzensis]
MLVQLNIGSLYVALPAVVAHFHAGPAASIWILLTYQLFNTVLILLFGKFSDIFGRRQLYLAGFLVFTAASLVIGFLDNVASLLVLRVLQAAGGALIITNTTALITDAFPREHLQSGLSMNVLVSSAAQLLGPIAGGLLATLAGWQWVFWFNVPFGIAGIVWGMVALAPQRKPSYREPIDGWGNLFAFLSLSGIILAVSEGGIVGWGAPVVLVGWALAVVLGPIFILHERRTAHPMVDLALFNIRPYAMANVAAFLNAMARSTVVLLVALFYQSLYHLSPLQASLRVIPVTVGMVIAAPLSGRLARRYPARILSTAGLVATMLGLIILVFLLSLNIPFWLVGIAIFCTGFGSGFFLTPNTSSIMLSIPASHRGMVNGIRSMLQNMGLVLSTALSLTLIANNLPPRLKNAMFLGTVTRIPLTDIARFIDGYRYAFAAMGIATVLGIFTSLMRGKVQSRSTF